MNGFDGDARAFVQAHVDEHGFLSWLHLTVESLEPGNLVMRVPYDEKLANHNPGAKGHVHGGIAATLVDTAGGVACRSALDDPVAGGAATIDLDVSYLRPAVGDLVADAEVVRVGSTVGVAAVTVESETPDGDHAEVAAGKGSYRLFRGD
jgi:uncharacterized protein (TIGR00369 family)